MSEQNVEIVRRGYAHFIATGDLLDEVAAPDFVWDMSKFRGWPEQQLYRGVEGARHFIRDWGEAWDDWEIAVDGLHDAGEKVVVIVKQRGRSKAASMPVEMTFAQVFTIEDGLETRMEMYSEPAEAFEAVGLER